MSNNHKIIQLENRVKELENVVEQYNRILYPLFGVKKCKKVGNSDADKKRKIIEKIRDCINCSNKRLNK